MPMATRLGRMITYLDVLLPMKSSDPLNTSSSRDKLKALQLQYNSAYRLQTW